MKRRKALSLFALGAVVATVGKPSTSQAQPTEALLCPSAQDIQPAQLYGLWQLQLWPEAALEDGPAASRGALVFERHPEYPGSVRGELRRRSPSGQELKALVSGDITDGTFQLDESEDGQHISAVWIGELTDCGRELRGVRRPAEGQADNQPEQNFRLRRAAGW